MQIPPLIYGTAWKEERTADLVEKALRTGFRGIDTACQPKHYNEAGVGEGIRRVLADGTKREELYIQTKFTPPGGHDPLRIPYDPEAALEDQVAQSFSASCRNLGVSYLDALVLHSPLFPYSQLLRVWRAMEKIAHEGGALRLGISNCYDEELFLRLYEDAEVKPAILQNRFYDQSGYDTELRKICADRGVVYQSFWSLTANPHLLRSVPVTDAAVRCGATPAQVFYRFLNRMGIVPLIGTTSVEHMREDQAIFDFDLEDQEIEAIAAVFLR